MKKLLRMIPAAFMAAALPLVYAGSLSPDLQQDLAHLGLLSSTNVIVQLNIPLADVLNQITATGATVVSELPLINAVLCTASALEIRLLSVLPGVAYITPDRAIAAKLDYAQPSVNANLARQSGWNGSGIGIAIIDSGITPVADLNFNGSVLSRIIYSENFSDRTVNTTDQYGHGTHVAGILAGNGAQSTGTGYTRTFLGIAPNATLINLKVLDASGAGRDSAVIRAIQQAVNLKNVLNIRAINLSLGRPVFESYKLDPLCQAAEQAWKSGVVVVVAAGNNGRDNANGTNGYGTINAPANDPYVITVGAMKTMGTPSRSDDLIASYSSKGPTTIDHFVKPDVVAPGNLIASLLSPNSALSATYPQNAVLYTYYKTASAANTSSSYFRLSGTSMATPMVTGAVALLLQQRSTLTPDQIKARLMKTASKTFPASSIATDPVTGATYTSQYDLFTIGAGYVDVWAALNNSDIANGNALSPTARFESGSGNVYLVAAKGSTWDTNALWGNQTIWGSMAFVNGGGAVWGSSAAWGTSTNQGFNAVWGDSSGVPEQTGSQANQIAANGEK